MVSYQWSIKSTEKKKLTSTHLFVLLGSLHTHTKRLGALVALWTGQAMETWISVDTTLHSIHFVANIRHHVTLEERKKIISKIQAGLFMNKVQLAYEK